MKLFLFLFFLCLCVPYMLPAQDGDFDFGAPSLWALQMKRYDPDTTASAVVFKEFTMDGTSVGPEIDSSGKKRSPLPGSCRI